MDHKILFRLNDLFSRFAMGIEDKRRLDEFLSEYNQVLGDVTNLLKKVDEQNTLPAAGTVSNFNNLHQTITKEINKRIETQRAFDVPSCYGWIDGVLGGFRNGDLVIIGGRPSMGKTSLMLSLISNIALKAKLPVAVCSVEQTSDYFYYRFLSQQLEIPYLKLISGILNKEELEMITAFEEKVKNVPVYINADSSGSYENIERFIRKAVTENGCKIVMIDYLQLLESKYANHRGNREREVSTITRSLKKLAIELQIPIVVNSQLNRMVEQRGGNKHPQLSDLRESGAIEQDADKIIFVYREELYGIDCDDDGNSVQDTILLIIAKNKSGLLGQERFRFDVSFGIVSELDPVAPTDTLKIKFSESSRRLNELTDDKYPF